MLRRRVGCGWKLRAKRMFDDETMEITKVDPSTHVKV